MTPTPTTPSKPSKQSTTTLSACRSLDDDFTELVHTIATDMKVSERSLVVRSLVQAPRITQADGRVSLVALQQEIQNIAVRFQKDMRAFESEGGRWPTVVNRVSELIFGPLDPEQAAAIFGHLHYLRSHRHDSIAYALFHPVTHVPLVACTVSPLQWDALARLIQQNTKVPQHAVMDVSRVFAFAEAPKNCISYLLSRVRLDLRKTHPEIELLSTAVDQNLGFRGTSYRASNWQQLCVVEPRPYLYFDSEYATIRQVHEKFGEKRWDEIAKQSNGRFEISTAPLLDSLIFIHFIKHPGLPLPAETYRLKRDEV